MPAPIAISANEQEWIKQYLQENYDIIVVDAFDCQELSDAILKEKGIKISYSTFRRLFNLVPNTNAQSRFVLNGLAVAVGFKNWNFFKEYVAGFDTNIINQNIQIYCFQLPNSSKLILETVKNLPIHNWLGGYQLQSIINIAIENKDFELLDAVVHFPFEIDNHKVFEHLVIAFQSVYFQSVKGNDDLIAFVERNIAQSTVLKKCLLQAYVDESHLAGFLGLWFDAIQENSLPDLLLFKNLLMLQKAFVFGGGAT
ncbi:MAG: helix-turn-helix domain-containing protein [Flavobacterium sp.]|nr:helix-turn-helix domain-containing protein [Flavobacterium sp.]